MPVDPDALLREAAVRRARDLTALYDDLVPRDALLEGFILRGARISFGSLYKGIHRPKEMRGAAALTLTTAAPKHGKPAPYDDELDADAGTILYHYRAGPIDQADNRAL